MKQTLKQIITQSKNYITDELSFEEIKWLLLDTFSLCDYQLITLENEMFDDKEFFKKLEKAKNVPVSYILNYQDFYGYKFYVDNNVLIPRNETEELVTLVLNFIKNNFKKPIKILEVGSGSGCISIALKKELDKLSIDSDIISCDISKKALEIAKKNALEIGAEVKFIESNCLDNINEEFDILVSNPPYIKRGNYVSKRVLDNEPHIALFADNDGLAIYEKIFTQINKNIKGLFFEISPDLVEGLEILKEKYLVNFSAKYIKDMNGFVRFALYINNE